MQYKKDYIGKIYYFEHLRIDNIGISFYLISNIADLFKYLWYFKYLRFK